MHNTQKDLDIKFLRVAKEISEWSKCLSRKIGAVIVKDKQIVSTGYNGAPSGVLHCEERSFEFYGTLDGRTSILPLVNEEINVCPRRKFGYKSGEGLHLCQAGHAERNTLIQCAKHGIATKDASIYCYCGQVCKDCAIEIINAGIKELIYLDGMSVYDNYSSTLIEESDLIVRKIKEDDINCFK